MIPTFDIFWSPVTYYVLMSSQILTSYTQNLTFLWKWAIFSNSESQMSMSGSKNDWHFWICQVFWAPTLTSDISVFCIVPCLHIEIWISGSLRKLIDHVACNHLALRSGHVSSWCHHQQGSRHYLQAIRYTAPHQDFIWPRWCWCLVILWQWR